MMESAKEDVREDPTFQEFYDEKLSEVTVLEMLDYVNDGAAKANIEIATVAFLRKIYNKKYGV